MSELQFDRFPDPPSFLVWKARFKTQVSSGSDSPSGAMLRIKEVDMVDSLDELKSSQSLYGKDFPNFEMLDARVASALNKMIQNFHFSKKVSLEEDLSHMLMAQTKVRLQRSRPPPKDTHWPTEKSRGKHATQ